MTVNVLFQSFDKFKIMFYPYFVCSQALLAYMFHELMFYCTRSVEESSFFSFELVKGVIEDLLFLNFWNGNSLQRICLGAAPHGFLVPKVTLRLIAAFYSLFDRSPICLSTVGFDDKLFSSLVLHLKLKKKKVIRSLTFRPKDLEKSLALPSVKILDRYDYRSILDFLLLKLRTALDSDWLLSLPDLHKVN